MDLFEEDSDYFKEDNDYFGFYEDAVPREAKDENSKALYEGNLSTIRPHSEYISLEQESKHGHQETTGYNEPSIDPAAYTLEGSHKAWIGHSCPRHMPSKMPYSVIAQHIDSNLFQDEVPVNLMSDMFQLSDNLETDTQFTEWEKKNTLQRKAEKNPHKFGSMNSRDFMEVHNDKTRRPNSGSNDRHRKVVTSRGPRDSRMRLPLETAFKFFDVQDRLGFDQPSKAVEWLIKNSSSAIDQLPVISPSTLEISAHLTLNSDSLPFLYRDADDSRANFGPGCQENMGISYSLSSSLLTESSTPKEKSWSKHKTENPRKNSVQAALANSTGRRRHIASLKEIRSKARERARERTKKKGTLEEPLHLLHHI